MIDYRWVFPQQFGLNDNWIRTDGFLIFLYHWSLCIASTLLTYYPWEHYTKHEALYLDPLTAIAPDRHKLLLLPINDLSLDENLLSDISSGICLLNSPVSYINKLNGSAYFLCELYVPCLYSSSVWLTLWYLYKLVVTFRVSVSEPILSTITKSF